MRPNMRGFTPQGHMVPHLLVASQRGNVVSILGTLGTISVSHKIQYFQ